MSFTQIFGNFILYKAYRKHPHANMPDEKSFHLYYESLLRTTSSSEISVIIRIYQSPTIPPLPRLTEAFVYGYFIYDMFNDDVKIEAIQIMPYPKPSANNLTAAFAPRVTIAGYVLGEPEVISKDLKVFPINSTAFVEDFTQVTTIM
jgi:hypothetical protein